MDPTKLTSTNPNAGTHLSDLNPLKGIFRTAGVQNVEKAFSRGGGMPNQKTATGTNTSSADIVEPREDKLQGVGAEHFQRDVAEQKPAADPISKAWNQLTTNTDQGK